MDEHAADADGDERRQGPAGTGPHPVPARTAEPHFPAMPASPAQWRYLAPRTPSWWHRHRRALRALGLVALLMLCGLVIMALVREQTGTAGLLVGLGLAVLPVPLLVAAFRWLDGVETTPWRQHLFAFAWGACAATLVAISANSVAADWLTRAFADSPQEATTLGSSVIAPLVEESAKGAAVVLLLVFRRRDFVGVVSGLAAAGITATGFAFTENVLYLGTAYGEDRLVPPTALHDSATATTFFVRIILAPFAHPLFTSLTGLALGIVAAVPRRHRVLRWVVPVLGLLTAALLHGIWNRSAAYPGLVFIAVYGLFMLPVFGALTWLGIWSRRQELTTVRDTLPSYAAVGWFAPQEPFALGSMQARAAARGAARRSFGHTGARAVAEYHHFATALALLRARAQHGSPAPDFEAREHELLHHVWQRHILAGPPTAAAGAALGEWGGADPELDCDCADCRDSPGEGPAASA